MNSLALHSNIWMCLAPHSNIIPPCQFLSSQKLPATALCHPCPHSLFSLISDVTAFSSTASCSCDALIISFSQRIPTHWGYWCMGEGRTWEGIESAAAFQGWWKLGGDTELARAAALQSNSLGGCSRDAAAIRDTWFNKKLVPDQSHFLVWWDMWLNSYRGSNKCHTPWFYEDFWHNLMYILMLFVKALCTARCVQQPHSESSHL